MMNLKLLSVGIDLLRLSETSDDVVYLLSSGRSQEVVTLSRSGREIYFFQYSGLSIQTQDSICASLDMIYMH